MANNIASPEKVWRYQLQDGTWEPYELEFCKQLSSNFDKKVGKFLFEAKATGNPGRDNLLYEFDLEKNCEHLYNMKLEKRWLVRTIAIKGKPGIPVGPLEPQQIAPNGCQLIWKPPTNSKNDTVRYKVYQKKTSDVEWGNAITELEQTTYVVDSLMPATAYHFKVTTVNDWGESEALETTKSICITGIPGIPVGPLEPQYITATSCQLNWKSPSNYDYAPVHYYKVYKKKKNEKDWGKAVKDHLDETFYTVNNLMPMTAYDFKVAAVNKWGESEALQTSMSICTKGAPGIPIGPLEPKNIAATSCQLDWKPPFNSNYMPVNHYQVYKKSINDMGWDKAIIKVTTTSSVVDNLMPATKYDFKVIAVNEWGESEALETSESICTKRILPPPRQPLIVTNIEAHSYQLQWEHAETSNEVLLKCYEVIVQKAADGNWVHAEGLDFVKYNSCTLEGLSSDTDYRFQVIAVYYARNIEQKSDPIETVIKTKSSGMPNSLSQKHYLYETKEIKCDRKEYKQISDAFYESVDSSKYKIIKIERIDNETLLDQYQCVKEEIVKCHPYSKSPLEMKLWHGMSVRTTKIGLQPIVSINAKGFNRSYSGLSNGAVYGDGVYFAVKASTSLKYAVPDENGRSYVYYCNVMTGSFTNGRSGLKYPPYKDNKENKSGSNTDTFDSVVDNVSSPSMFVIFRDNQALPEYLITFQ